MTVPVAGFRWIHGFPLIWVASLLNSSIVGRSPTNVPRKLSAPCGTGSEWTQLTAAKLLYNAASAGAAPNTKHHADDQGECIKICAAGAIEGPGYGLHDRGIHPNAFLNSAKRQGKGVPQFSSPPHLPKQKVQELRERVILQHCKASA